MKVSDKSMWSFSSLTSSSSSNLRIACYKHIRIYRKFNNCSFPLCLGFPTSLCHLVIQVAYLHIFTSSFKFLNYISLSFKQYSLSANDLPFLHLVPCLASGPGSKFRCWYTTVFSGHIFSGSASTLHS